MFIKIPEIQIDTENVLFHVLNSQNTDWDLLPWGQYVFSKWKGNFEIYKLIFMFSKSKLNPIIDCMKFDPGSLLPIHRDGTRSAVIQIPLSLNCQTTPTSFYNNDKTFFDKIEWIDHTSWMFDTQILHNIENKSKDPRYMLCISFYKQSYATLLNLYNTNMLFHSYRSL